MERKEFIEKALKLGFCSSALLALDMDKIFAGTKTGDEDVAILKMQKEFIQNWLTDLLDSIDKNLDRETQVKIVEACGKGCFNRHKFKQDLAEKGKGDLQKLIEAMKNNFEIWQEEDKVHIRYGEVNKQCYCPAANYREQKPNDIHCECTRMTHQTIFETALGRPFKVDIVESLRRGGTTCHFLVHLS